MSSRRARFVLPLSPVEAGGKKRVASCHPSQRHEAADARTNTHLRPTSSFNFMVVSALPSQYFSRKKGLATGIVYAGGGLGGAVLAPGIDALLGRVGVAWTFRIMGVIVLATGLPMAYLIKEVRPRTTGGMVNM